ncbi:MAG: hypothetical protein ACYC4Q_08125 [Victivallaceae bacterium]
MCNHAVLAQKHTQIVGLPNIFTLLYYFVLFGIAFFNSSLYNSRKEGDHSFQIASGIRRQKREFETYEEAQHSTDETAAGHRRNKEMHQAWGS